MMSSDSSPKYISMDADELERQYSPSRWSHRLSADQVISAHTKCVALSSLRSREQVATELGVAYGKSDKEQLDVFAKDVPKDAPIFVYIHGGYWQAVDLEISSFMAVPMTRGGAVVVSVGYDLAPDVTMDEIVSQVKKAISYVIHMAKRRGSKGVYLCGHSAGAQLAAMAMTADWMSEYMLSSKMISGAILVSGVYDVRPIVKTYVNDPIKMSDEDAQRNSPLLNLSENVLKRMDHMEILIVAGEHDSPEFKRQSAEFDECLRKGGVRTRLKIIENTDHFDIVEKMESADFCLIQDCLKMMKLS